MKSKRIQTGWSTLLCVMLASACNTTPERKLNEGLPGQASVPAKVAPSAQTSPVPAVTAGPSSSPVSTAAPDATGPTAAPAAILKQGSFVNGAHRVSGRGLLIESEGKRYARLEDFSTENGPDLYVYLVRHIDGRAGSPGEFVSLGRLRATTGNQNYEIPAGTDLSRIQAMTIWCQAFSVNFGYAALP